MFRRIVVPLDGSTGSEIVIPYVMAIASRSATEVVLITVAHPRKSEVDQLHHAYLDRMTEYLQLQLKEAGQNESIIKTEVLQGKRAEEIVKYADAVDADLIAISTQGPSGQKPTLMGRVSVRILWSTRRPVLLIRSQAGEQALKSQKLFNKILLPLDSSTAGEAAMERAASLARMFNAELVLFQAITPIQFVSGYEMMVPLALPRSEDIMDAALLYLNKVKAQMEQKSYIKITVEAKWGSAAESILNYAETHQIDLIAISAHGQSNISRWVFGSVTDKILQAGQSAVLIVH